MSQMKALQEVTFPRQPRPREFVTEPNLGYSPHAQGSQSIDTGVWWRKVQHLLQGAKHRVLVEQIGSCSKDLNSPLAFRERFLKTGWERGVIGVPHQLMDILQIVWWEPTSSTFWFQLVWGLCDFGSIWLTFFTWWGFQYLQNSSQDMA